MKRFERHQKKQLTTAPIIFTVILFITIYFVFAIGIKILLNLSVFIANLTSKKTEPSPVKNTTIYGSIYIDNIPPATNSAKIVIAGSVFNLNKVEFYLNDEKVKEITLYSSDNFSEEIGELKVGDNEVYVKGKTIDEKIVKQSKKFTVFYKPKKPKLELVEPADNTKTSQSEIKIKGSTDKETFIKVNDIPVVVDAVGNFETNLRLKEGDNIITIIAEDQAGNQEEKTLKVTYQP